MPLDFTHDPTRGSWLAEANEADCDFPLQNLPLGIFRRRSAGGGASSDEAFRPGVAIGDSIVDMLAARSAGLLPADASDALNGTERGELNALMARGAPARTSLRHAISKALDTAQSAPDRELWQACLVAQAAAEMALPCRIGDYTDFYTGIHHATAVGKLFRPDEPLLPNYKWVPIGYHGRSSSIAVSGQRFRRPVGQTKLPNESQPSFGPCKRLDYELELGVFIGTGNALGTPIPISEAEDHAVGLVLLNDWSARDIQAWEYQPLGPFLAKNFATTISPWIVTMEALAPFRSAFERPAGDPPPLPYLDSPHNRAHGAVEIELEVLLQTEAMRSADLPPQRLTRSNYRDAYWTLAQMITHHSVNGCNLQPGDMLGTGTQSGPRPGEGGSLLELSRGGKEPLTLANGERRTFLEDGDRVVMRARCVRDGFRSIGFGACEGAVLASLQNSSC